MDKREKEHYLNRFEKVLNIVQYPLIMKALGNSAIEKNFLNLIEAVL